MVSVKVKLVLALVFFFVGMVFGALAGYGVFRVPQPVFELWLLVGFICLTFEAIRKWMKKKTSVRALKAEVERRLRTDITDIPIKEENAPKVRRDLNEEES